MQKRLLKSGQHSIEKISESNYLVFNSCTNKSYILNSSAFLYYEFCDGNKAEEINEKYIQRYIKFTNNREVLEADAANLLLQLKAIGLIEEFYND